MVVLGITGLIAAGKSTITQKIITQLEQQGLRYLIFDCDAECHRIIEGQDRVKIAEKVFSDPKALKEWQKGIWNKLALALEQTISLHNKKADCDIILLDAPLLYQAGFDKYCTSIVFITAPENIRKERFLTRQGSQTPVTPTDFEKRNRIQADYFASNPQIKPALTIDTSTQTEQSELQLITKFLTKLF